MLSRVNHLERKSVFVARREYRAEEQLLDRPGDWKDVKKTRLATPRQRSTMPSVRVPPVSVLSSMLFLMCQEGTRQPASAAQVVSSRHKKESMVHILMCRL